MGEEKSKFVILVEKSWPILLKNEFEIPQWKGIPLQCNEKFNFSKKNSIF